ncbi:MAG: ATP-dependent DNA helicase [Sarcina sp.]
MTRILVDYNEKTLSQCALSGKAAQRIQEVTGYEAMTIHRLLEYDPRGEVPFGYNKDCQLESDIIILDEASMVDISMFLNLIEAIKTGTKLCILGDQGQLDAIGAGNVLKDLIDSEIVPCVKLTKIHRQAQKSAIITESINIRNNNQIVGYGEECNKILGELQDLEVISRVNREKLVDIVIDKFKERLKVEKDIMKVQIVAATRTRGELSTFNLNNKIKQIVNPSNDFNLPMECKVDKNHTYKIDVGDKIIITKNNYKVEVWDNKKQGFAKGQVFNGNVGRVVSIGIDCAELEIEGVGLVIIKSKNYNDIELAYAISIHKSQGNQCESVIVAIDTGAYMMLSCELLYTAITRAMNYCILVGENKAIRKCCSYSQGNYKQTFLKSFLKDMEDRLIKISEEIG